MTVETIIQSEIGLHARPAALFVQTANQFQSDIRILHNGSIANGKSLLNILGLGVKKGEKITIEANGEDNTAALTALKVLIENNFYE